MVFTSYLYVLFLAATFLIHWLLSPRFRKPLLVVASYVFYCSWKWQFGFLLLGVTVFNWSYARWVLSRRPTAGLLTIGILTNLAPLVYFKYFGFIEQNIQWLAGIFRINLSFVELNIILPLGISFFTFQGIAYLFDVAAGERPFVSALDFLLFKSFWPQLIAGPIVRVDEMRPQFARDTHLTYEDFAYGCQRILFGFFKKVVLADSLAPIVDMVFRSNASPNALDSAAAILGFGMQIYLDFSAYSDIAIGSARLFGYRLPENFAWPYLSRSPQEFWNRWHITLSRWIRDYVFRPLTLVTRAHPRYAHAWLLVAMAACGLWHGARWTFVIWGTWHGLMLLSNRTLLRGWFAQATSTPVAPIGMWRVWLSVAVTFILVNLGWVFFRSQSLAQAADLVRSLATVRGGIRPAVLRENDILIVGLIFGLLLAAHVVEASGLACAAQRQWSTRLWVRVAKPIAYATACALVVVFSQEARAFVYFQF